MKQEHKSYEMWGIGPPVYLKNRTHLPSFFFFDECTHLQFTTGKWKMPSNCEPAMVRKMYK